MSGWRLLAGNLQVRNQAVGSGLENILSQKIELNRLCRLGHALRMVNTRISNCMPFFVPPSEPKNAKLGSTDGVEVENEEMYGERG